MKATARIRTLSTLITATTAALMLCSCALSIHTSDDSQLDQEQVMATCGLGVIHTPDGPRPAISESPMPVDAYRTYTDCVKSLSPQPAKPSDAETRTDKRPTV